MELDVLDEPLERLRGWGPSAFSDTESIVSLTRDLARLEAFVTEATAAFDAAGNWAPDGALTAVAWVTAKCRVPRREARIRLRRGRELRFLPETTRAWAEGAITGAHVDVMTSLRCPETKDALARDEAMLVDQARKLTFADFVRAAAYWKQLAGPDGATRMPSGAGVDGRSTWSGASAGPELGAMNLDPINGTIVSEELERLEHQLFEADRAEAGLPRPGPGTGEHLGHSPARRAAPRWRWPSDSKSLREKPECRPPCSRSWSGGKRCMGGSASWRTAPSSPRGHCCRGWTGPIWSGPCSPPAAASRSAPPTGCSPGPPAGPSRSGTASAPTPSAR